MPEKDNKTAPNDPRRRGRKPVDMVYKLRAWVWLSEILWRTDTSLRGLDRLLLGDQHEGLRAFWRIQRDGYDPGRKRVSLGNLNLVNVVAAQSDYQDTKKVYESPLWLEVLGPTEMTADRRQVLIEELQLKLQLFQADGTDEFISSEMKLNLPALRSCSQQEFGGYLKRLIERRNLDCILLQCLLYRRAMANAHLEEAICLRDSIFFSVKYFCDRPGFDGQTSGLFKHLINRRVFCGERNVEPSKQAVEEARECWSARRADAKTSAAHRQVDTMEFLWSIRFSLFDQRHLYALHDLNPEIESYLQQRTVLYEKSRKKSLIRATARAKRYIKKQRARELSFPDD